MCVWPAREPVGDRDGLDATWNGAGGHVVLTLSPCTGVRPCERALAEDTSRTAGELRTRGFLGAVCTGGEWKEHYHTPASASGGPLRVWRDGGVGGLGAEILALVLVHDGLDATRGAVRLVCTRWKAAHDANCRELRFSSTTTEEALRTVCNHFAGLTSIDTSRYVTMPVQGLQTLCTQTQLTSLNLGSCPIMTDKRLSTLAPLAALTTLQLEHCKKLTTKGIRTLCSQHTALTNLNLSRAR